MIIFDENVDQRIIDQIDKCRYEIISIKNVNPGISDREVIKFAKSKKGLIITEDKDFGELIFSYNIKECSVIFLRYNKIDLNKIEKNISKVLENFYQKPEHFFITITSDKIRIRKI